MTSIQVAVRVRPFNAREEKYGSQLIVDMPATTNLELKVVKNGKFTAEAPKKFNFDHCFWTHDKTRDDLSYADQEWVYRNLGAQILENSWQGFNSCLFAYGQTGSGKTYSMMGIPTDPGVIPRLCKALYERAEEHKDTNQVEVQCSYLEIYNEQVRDLLNPAGIDKTLRVRQHPKLGVYIENLTKMICRSEEEVSKLLDDGGKVRSVAATQMNATSSRSHAILTLNIKNRKADNELASQLHLVDLAGSERAQSTGATGDTLVEGSNINKSLTTLGMCLSRLAEAGDGKKGHVPFRDSQLTWILNDSLGGNSKTAMLANISPASINFEETMSTLRFATTVKKIKNHAVVNEDPQQKLIRELRAEIEDLKQKIQDWESGKGPGKAPKHADPNEGDRTPTSGSLTPGVVDGEDEGQTKEELMQLLKDNTKLFMEVGESAEDRSVRDREQRAEHAKAMRAIEQSGVSVDQSLPRLVTLNEDLHAYPTVALLYYLRQGENLIGRKAAKLGDSVEGEQEGEEEGDELPVAVDLPLAPTKQFEPVQAAHCIITVDTLKRTVYLRRAQPATEDDQPPVVYVDGDELEDNEPIQLKHLDRIFIGQFAFRHSQPLTWYSATSGDEFMRQPLSLAHLELVESHERLEIQNKLFSELVSAITEISDELVGGDSSAFVSADAEQALQENVQETMFGLGESETILVTNYPITQEALAKLAAKHGESGLQFDYNYASEERGKRKRQEKLQQMEETKKQEINALEAQRAEKDSTIADLEKMLKQEEAAKAAAEEQARQVRERKNSTAVNSLEASTSVGRSSLSGTGLAFAELARELHEYEEAKRQARMWKPNGPNVTGDIAEYQFSTSSQATLEAVLAKGEVLKDVVVQKLRIKSGLFSRGGFHPVRVIVRPRFLYYFDTKAKDKSAALGALYIYGSSLQTQKPQDKMDGKTGCLRLIPAVPRKPSKSASAPTEENNVVVYIEDDAEKADFRSLLERLSVPQPSDKVAEYLKKHPEDDY